MAWAYRASSYANNGAGVTIANGATATVTLGAALSNADLIVLVINALDTATGAAAATFSVSGGTSLSSTAWSETQGGTVTWTVASVSVRTSVWVFPNVAAGTPTATVTINGTGARTYNVGLQILAFSGIDTSTTPKDVGAAATGTGGSPSSGAVGATGAANELMVGCYMDAGEGVTLTEGNINGVGATLAGKHASDSGKWEGLVEYGDSGSSAGTPTATLTTGTPNAGWGMIAVVLKNAAGAAQDTPELYGRPYGRTGQNLMQQLLAQ